jgi:hypothetical protein
MTMPGSGSVGLLALGTTTGSGSGAAMGTSGSNMRLWMIVMVDVGFMLCASAGDYFVVSGLPFISTAKRGAASIAELANFIVAVRASPCGIALRLSICEVWS